MKLIRLAAISACFGATLLAQSATSVGSLAPQTTFPIAFTQTIDANQVHDGDVISARTTQRVTLQNGQAIESGARVQGHIVAAHTYKFDRTPYAKQSASTLSIHFDSITAKTGTYPLNVYVRAMADPIVSWNARKPKPSDEDPDGTLTQVGGELLKPHQGEVITMDEDIVGYSRRGGIYAHLIAASGNSAEGCDGSDTEQSVAIFSASACGLYGFSGTSLEHSGRVGEPPTVVLVARRSSVEIVKNTSALLEVLPVNQTNASR